MFKNAAVVLLVLAVCGSVFADDVTVTNSTVLEWGFAGTGAVTSGPTTVYPSNINLSGVSGTVIDVNVTLNDGSHTWADDMEVALSSPDGTIVELWNDAGGSDDIAGSVTFDDAAAAPIDDATGTFPGSGTFQVSVYSVGTNNPAANGFTLADFNGENPNGDWGLWVYDDAGGDTGSFAGGWTLNVVTVPEPATFSLLGCLGLALLAIRRR